MSLVGRRHPETRSAGCFPGLPEGRFPTGTACGMNRSAGRQKRRETPGPPRNADQQQGVGVQPQLLLQPQLQPQPPPQLPPQPQLQPQPLPPQLELLPQQHQTMMSRMMIQQQLPPPKPVLHIRWNLLRDVDRLKRPQFIICAPDRRVPDSRKFFDPGYPGVTAASR